MLSEAGVSADSKFHKPGQRQIKKKREKDGRDPGNSKHSAAVRSQHTPI